MISSTSILHFHSQGPCTLVCIYLNPKLGNHSGQLICFIIHLFVQALIYEAVCHLLGIRIPYERLL